MNSNARKETKVRSALSRVSALLLCASLALSSAAILSGCKKTEEDWYPAGMKLASSEDADYNLWVPDTWTTDMSTGITSAYVGGGDYSNVSVMAFNLDAEDNYLTPAEYWERYKADLELTFPDIAYDEDTAEGISLLLNESAAMKYTYTATVTGTAYHFMSVICVREGTVYLLTYTAQPAVYEQNMEEVDKIIENFRFKS